MNKKAKIIHMKTKAIVILALSVSAGLPAFSQLKVTPNGYVGIGTNDPAVRLHVEGEGLVNSYASPWESALTTRVHYRNSSAYDLWNGYYHRNVFFVNGEGWTWSVQGHYVGTDSTVISDPAAVENALNTVLLLKGTKFRYTDDGPEHPSGTFRFGLVAQEVQRLVPEAVRIMPDSSLAVSYEDVIPLLVEAMKEQQSQIEELRITLGDHQSQIEKLKKRRWFRKNKTEELE
jgi:hypothetical protein